MRVLREIFTDDTRFFTVSLTDIEIRQAKAGDKPTKLTDGNGRYLAAHPSSSARRRSRYRTAPKENVFSIGEYATVSPQDACESARKQLRSPPTCIRRAAQCSSLRHSPRCSAATLFRPVAFA
ncbi:Arm DNA-binding domain-containing protein [Burkholderia sp. AU45388]|uniref:Arm DNA-binding domain-containing protein n=1 Tax=unclassified Burkholderia TaxID=2613784 RepID=UPI0034632BED